MKQRLTDKEKEEIRKLLEDQDKFDDKSWLMVEQYKNKKSKFKCILCEKTHSIKNCPNSKDHDKKEEETKNSGSQYSQYSYNEY